MVRGTTPTITVNLDTDASAVSALFLTIAQLGKTVIEKSLTDATIDGTTLTFPLSQDDTLALSGATKAKIQVRGRTGTHAFASQIVEVAVDEILKSGVI